MLFSFTFARRLQRRGQRDHLGRDLGLIQEGKVHWADPVYFDYAGGRLKVTLNDADFNEGFFGLDEGSRDAAKIKATFTLVRGGSAVPEPAMKPTPATVRTAAGTRVPIIATAQT